MSLPHPQAVARWSPQELAGWLEQKSLKSAVKAVMANKITGRNFMDTPISEIKQKFKSDKNDTRILSAIVEELRKADENYYESDNSWDDDDESEGIREKRYDTSIIETTDFNPTTLSGNRIPPPIPTELITTGSEYGEYMPPDEFEKFQDEDEYSNQTDSVKFHHSFSSSTQSPHMTLPNPPPSPFFPPIPPRNLREVVAMNTPAVVDQRPPPHPHHHDQEKEEEPWELIYEEEDKLASYPNSGGVYEPMPRDVSNADFNRPPDCPPALPPARNMSTAVAPPPMSHNIPPFLPPILAPRTNPSSRDLPRVPQKNSNERPPMMLNIDEQECVYEINELPKTPVTPCHSLPRPQINEGRSVNPPSKGVALPISLDAIKNHKLNSVPSSNQNKNSQKNTARSPPVINPGPGILKPTNIKLKDNDTNNNNNSNNNSNQNKLPGYAVPLKAVLPPTSHPPVSQPPTNHLPSKKLPPASPMILENKSWYKNVDRKSGEKILETCRKNGTFIVRPSSKDAVKPYTLVVYVDATIKNIPIRKKNNKFALGVSEKINELTFNTIQDMVQHYSMNKIEVSGPDGSIKEVTLIDSI